MQAMWLQLFSYCFRFPVSPSGQQGPFYWHGLTWIPASYVQWSVGWSYLSIPNLSGCTIEVWQRTSNFITHYITEVITYPYWIKVKPAISVDGSLADARRNIDVSGTTSDVVLSDVVMKSSLRHMFTKKLLLAERSLRAHCLFRN